MATDEAPDPYSEQDPPARLRGPLVDNRITRAFSLQTDPFTPQHDPRFIVGSKPMRKALARLRALLKERCQLILITGEAGIGKTALLDGIQRDSRATGRIARIDDPTRSWAEIGQEIGAQLELAGGRLSPGAVVTERGHGRILRIFIDSAQCLPDDSLNHLQAYLDLEAPPGKDVHLFQLVLIARNTAPAPVFGWLRKREHQRIGFERLDSSETRQYILRRLRVAAGEERTIFSEEALHRLAQATDGLPGAINQMCHVALDMAAKRGGGCIDSSLVQEVNERLKEARRRHRKAVIAARASVSAGAPTAGAAARDEAPGVEEEPEPCAGAMPDAAEAPGDAFVPPADFQSEATGFPADPPLAEAAAEDGAAPGQRAVWQHGDLLLEELDRMDDGSGRAARRRRLPQWALAFASLVLGGVGAVLLLRLVDEPLPPAPVAPVVEVQVPPAPSPEPAVEAVVAPEPVPPPVEETVARAPVPPVVKAPAPAPVEKPPSTTRVETKPAPRIVKVLRAPRPPSPARPAAPAPTPPAPTPEAPAPPPQPVASIPEPVQDAPAAPAPPARSASEVLERAFARFYHADQTRIVEIYEHADSGELPIEILKLARKQQRGRTLSLGVLVGSREREERRILSIERGEADDKRFAYHPGSRQTVPLTGSGGLWPFDGIHFSYDDFRPLSPERYHVDGQERSEDADGRLTLVSARPRHKASYSRVEFLVDTSDYTLLERHYYRGDGLRPYRIVQTPREYMQNVGGKLVPMRLIARDLKTGRISEAKVVEFARVDDLDSRLFTLGRMQQAELDVPNF